MVFVEGYSLTARKGCPQRNRPLSPGHSHRPILALAAFSFTQTRKPLKCDPIKHLLQKAYVWRGYRYQVQAPECSRVHSHLRIGAPYEGRRGGPVRSGFSAAKPSRACCLYYNISDRGHHAGAHSADTRESARERALSALAAARCCLSPSTRIKRGGTSLGHQPKCRGPARRGIFCARVSFCRAGQPIVG